MLDVSKLTNDELLFIGWSLSRIPEYLLKDDASLCKSLVKEIKVEQKNRGI